MLSRFSDAFFTLTCEDLTLFGVDRLSRRFAATMLQVTGMAVLGVNACIFAMLQVSRIGVSGVNTCRFTWKSM